MWGKDQWIKSKETVIGLKWQSSKKGGWRSYWNSWRVPLRLSFIWGYFSLYSSANELLEGFIGYKDSSKAIAVEKNSYKIQFQWSPPIRPHSKISDK